MKEQHQVRIHHPSVRNNRWQVHGQWSRLCDKCGPCGSPSLSRFHYLYAGGVVRGISWLKFRAGGTTFIALGVLNLVAFSWVLRKRYLPDQRNLRGRTENADAVKRWMSSWTILLCNANSLVVLGFAFWMGGKTLGQSLPFFVIGSLLILLLWPRQVWLPSKAVV
jgi:hypothetical protein